MSRLTGQADIHIDDVVDVLFKLICELIHNGDIIGSLSPSSQKNVQQGTSSAALIFSMVEKEGAFLEVSISVTNEVETPIFSAN